MTLPAIPKPNERSINTCWKKWKREEKTDPQEKVLHSLFKERYPENTKIEDILLKVSTLNDFYNTRILDTYTVSKHILNCKIDEGLWSGDIDLVNKIARVKIGEKTINFYSFASKYCSHHKPKTYPIYDKYVDEMLWHFKKKDKFLEFKRYELKEYKKFSEIVNAFKRHYGLESCLRKIDIYLWLTGKKLDEQRRQGVHQV